jgi:hypothetical protein
VASATCRFVLAAAIALGSCSSDGGSSAATPAPSTTASDASAGTLPLVGLVDDAVNALEAKLGGPQQFFEINATAQLINLIVALNDGKVAQPWVYLDGELSSTEGAAATGFSFARSALDFDPDKVLSKLQAELPESSPDLFFIEGGEGGTVRYSVAVTSKQGGQLVVVVGPDGTVQSVTPN